MTSLHKIIDRASKIKLRGGIVGKMITTTVLLIICVTAVAIVSGSLTLQCVSVALIAVIFVYTFERSVRFAAANPYIAVFDGAELLLHEHLEVQAKDKSINIDTHLVEADVIQCSTGDKPAEKELQYA